MGEFVDQERLALNLFLLLLIEARYFAPQVRSHDLCLSCCKSLLNLTINRYS